MLDAFGITDAPDLTRWDEVLSSVREPEGEVNIAVVGKYTELKDAYKSLIERADGGIANQVRVNLEWMDAQIFERERRRLS